MAAYAQPLIEASDGTVEAVNTAMHIAMLCWNLAILPHEEMDKMLGGMQQELQMGDQEFAHFRRDIIEPMIQRHHKMFPGLHRQAVERDEDAEPLAHMRLDRPARREAYPGTGRNAPCPCGSGKKYKRCCGQ